MAYLSGGRNNWVNPKFFEDIDRFIQQNNYSRHVLNAKMDQLAHLMAITCLAFAQGKSHGPLDRSARSGGALGAQSRSLGHGQFDIAINAQRKHFRAMAVKSFNRGSLAWRIPVRRISQVYFYAWFAHRLNRGHWETANFSREAFFIEFGINHDRLGATGLKDSAGNRVRIRRPIMKLSLLATLRYIEGTGVERRIMQQIFIGDNNRSTGAVGTTMQSGNIGTVIGQGGQTNAFGQSTLQKIPTMHFA